MIAAKLRQYRRQNEPSPEFTALADFLDSELVKAKSTFRAKALEPTMPTADHVGNLKSLEVEGRECRLENLTWETNPMRNAKREVWPAYMRGRERVKEEVRGTGESDGGET